MEALKAMKLHILFSALCHYHSITNPRYPMIMTSFCRDLEMTKLGFPEALESLPMILHQFQKSRNILISVWHFCVIKAWQAETAPCLVLTDSDHISVCHLKRQLARLLLYHRSRLSLIPWWTALYHGKTYHISKINSYKKNRPSENVNLCPPTRGLPY